MSDFNNGLRTEAASIDDGRSGTLEKPYHFQRLLDLFGVVALSVVAIPMVVVAGVAVRFTSNGPILYTQSRLGRDGKRFRIVKLRTMYHNCEAASGIRWSTANDPRVTPLGRVLRRLHVDELPQLWNVLKGDMSLVGPRPERPMFVAELTSQIPLYPERHMVKAGLTGWAQVNYPYGASVDDARSKLSYDLYYVKNFSILFDLIILMQTLRVVLWPSGVR